METTRTCWFGLPIRAHYAPAIEPLVRRGWLEQIGDTIRLTDEGLLWHSEVALAFFAK
jgi:coproporphyrinogen III oxidase-like Fe-S oxidoreductase